MPTTAIVPVRRRSGSTSIASILGYIMGGLLLIGGIAFLALADTAESLSQTEPDAQLPGVIGGWSAAADVLTIIAYVIMAIAAAYILAAYLVARMKLGGWVLMMVLSGTMLSCSLVGRQVSPNNLTLWLNLIIVVLLLLQNTRHDCNIGRPPDPTIDDIMYQASDDMLSAGTSTPMPGYNTPGAGFNLPTAYEAVPMNQESQDRARAASVQTSTLDPTYAAPHAKAVWDHGCGAWVLWDKERSVFHRHDPASNSWSVMD